MKRMLSHNLFKIFLASFTTFSLSACLFTSNWNDKIDQQVVWSHNFGDYYSRNERLAPEPIAKDTYGSYYKGEYTGIKELNKQKYNSYIFPNLSKISKKRFMEILLPVSNAESVAIIRTFDQYVKHKEYTYKTVSSGKEAHYKYSVYLRHLSMITKDAPLVNPKFISDIEAQWYNYYHSPNYFSDDAFSTNYPFLLDLTLISSNTEATIRYSRKSNDAANVSNQNLQTVYICPTTTNKADALAMSQQSSDDCDRWIWSLPIRTKFDNLHTQGDDLEKDRHLGYFLTIPLDVITFPVQAVVAVIWVPVAMMFQH